MILQIISFIFSLLRYTVLIALVLFVVWFIYITVYLLKFANDFPNKRRMCTSTRKLTGQTAVVTGSNTGIGFETAKDFAARGARVIMVCRNMQKAEAARSKIIASTGNEDVVTMQCEFGDLESVQNFCKKFLAKESALHILVNNAGTVSPGQLTKQKFHAIFGTNYVAPFLLTYLLLDLLKKSAPSRIVNVASGRHYSPRQMGLLLEEDGIKFPQMESYESSKLANVLHTKALARQLNGTGVAVYTLHPGFIYEGLPLNRSQNVAGMRHTFITYMIWLLKFTSITVKQGAQTTIFCAVDESVAHDSGKCYDNCKVKEPSKLALDTDLARRLWNATLEVVSDYTKLSE